MTTELLTTATEPRDEGVIERTKLGVVFRSATDAAYGVYHFGSMERVKWFHTLAAALNAVHPAEDKQ